MRLVDHILENCLKNATMRIGLERQGGRPVRQRRGGEEMVSCLLRRPIVRGRKTGRSGDDYEEDDINNNLTSTTPVTPHPPTTAIRIITGRAALPGGIYNRVTIIKQKHNKKHNNNS